MDPFKKTIKQALDDNVYNDIELDEKGKREFITRLQHTKTIAKRKRDYSKVAAVVGGLCAMIILFIIAAPYFQKFDTRSGELQKQISQEYGEKVILPSIKNTHILLVTISEPNTKNKQLSVTYGMDTEDKVTVSDQARELEANKHLKIVYGPQNGKPVILLSYDQGKLRNEKIPSDQSINGIPVSTQKISVNGRNFYDVQIQAPKGNYKLQIEINSTFTEENIQELLKQFTLQLKE